MRSLLFVPGDSPKKIDKALSSGADVLLLDLEDSVAPSAKSEARTIVADLLKAHADITNAPKLYVRINALDSGFAVFFQRGYERRHQLCRRKQGVCMQSRQL